MRSNDDKYYRNNAAVCRQSEGTSGNTLDSVIVYGSYARGDYSELSDIDVMILVTLSEEKIKKISDEISDMAFEYLMKFGVDISPVITNIDHFNYWVDNLPYYRNVRDEGVRLSA